MIFKIPFYWLYYYFGWPKILPLSYTFSLTNKCNSRCRTCNIWQKKPGRELTGGEWKQIFQSLGPAPYWVTLSGGEPFLRDDLVEIINDLCFFCRPKIINLPTNGLLTEKITKDTVKMTKAHPKINFVINLSLDGVGGKHDEARGIKGNFAQTLKTFSQLKNKKTQNLTLGVHTVISKNNVKNFPQICDFVLDQLKPDSYITEIAENRVELDNLNSNITPKIEDYKKAMVYLKQKAKISKLDVGATNKQKGFGRLIQAFRLTYYQLVGEIFESKSQAIPCYAGIASAQIAPNGDVWPCCVRADVLGNLREENFDFAKIWNSGKAKKIRKSIKSRQCWCPLANAGYTNILLSPKTIIRVMLNYLK